MKSKYKKDNLEMIVKISNSYADVNRHLGNSVRGSNFKTIKKYIKLYSLDIKHFNINYHKIKLHALKIRISNENVFIKNSTYNNNAHLKQRLIKDNLIFYECFYCKNKGEWNTKKLVLQLDHIDGDPKNNCLINLRFLCPNCHSQTDTFCNKKRKHNQK